ncbi:MAG: autotransporter domain-containing protein [Pseudomonadota bacterium]
MAFGGDAFSTPGYSETAAAGAPTFALAYASNTIDNQHVEAGPHPARGFGLGNDVISLGADAAWAHQLSGPSVIEAAFAGLSGSNFRVRGLAPTKDTALVGLGVQIQGGGGLSYGMRGDGQFGEGISALSGTLNLVYRF